MTRGAGRPERGPLISTTRTGPHTVAQPTRQSDSVELSTRRLHPPGPNLPRALGVVWSCAYVGWDKRERDLCSLLGHRKQASHAQPHYERHRLGIEEL